jgi:hypothetical protein
MNEFWLHAGAESIAPEDIQRAVSEAKPGYYLLLAQKLPGPKRPRKGESL